MIILRFSGLLLLCFFLSFCSKKKDPQIQETPEVPASVAFQFDATMKGKTIAPETKYINDSKDTLTVSKLTYYITNVRLTRDDGTIYSEPESYHLIQHLENKTSFNWSGVPLGTYTKVEFLVGVDSLTNVSGIRTGALDLSNDMYWQWEGYLFLKMEGTFNSNERTETGDYAIHVGGYKAPNSCLQFCSFKLATPLVIKNGGTASILYTVNVEELFMNPKSIGFDYYYDNIASDPTIFQKISENYKDMFVVSKVQN